MPSDWVVPLGGASQPIIPAEAPHAVVSRWLDSNHTAAVKPYSILPPVSAGDRTALTVRLLDDDLAPRLLQATAPGSAVRLGRHHFTVTQPPTLRSLSTWAELESAPVVRAWQVEFATPVTFRNGQRTSPWPAPSSVLTGLAARWSGLRTSGAPELSRSASSSVWVSDVEGRSEPLELKQNVVSAFIGRIRYVCDGTEAEAATVSALFAFSAYAGIGSHTAFGLGAVRLAPTWQPRSGTIEKARARRQGSGGRGCTQVLNVTAPSPASQPQGSPVTPG